MAYSLKTPFTLSFCVILLTLSEKLVLWLHLVRFNYYFFSAALPPTLQSAFRTFLEKKVALVSTMFNDDDMTD